MATRLRWWTIPATVVVLARVVTLDSEPVDEAAPPVPAAAPIAEPAVGANAEMVVLRDASGARSRPLRMSVEDALTLQLPAVVAGTRVDLTLLRYLPHETEPSPWLRGDPLARADATVPILGLPAGRYALELSWTEGGQARRLERRDVMVPGTVDVTQ